jgi:hypothetical protein
MAQLNSGLFARGANSTSGRFGRPTAAPLVLAPVYAQAAQPPPAQNMTPTKLRYAYAPPNELRRTVRFEERVPSAPSPTVGPYDYSRHCDGHMARQ